MLPQASMIPLAPKLLRAAFCVLLGSILAGFIFGQPSGPSVANATEKPALASETLKTIIIDNYAPYTYVNAQGQPDGFSVDLMRAVAQVMGFQLDIRVDTWANALQALQTGGIDFLPMMAYSQERDKVFDFSPPHTIAYDAFFMRKGASPIRSIDDLRGKTIIVMQGDQAHDYLHSVSFITPDQLTLVDSLPKALQLLASGTGDTALMPKLVGLMLIRDLHLTNLELAPAVVDAYNRPFSFAVKQGNQALLDRLSQGLSIVKTTGQYNQIYQKWFGMLEPQGLTLSTVLPYLGGLALVFALLGAVPVVWSFSLRRQVAARTRLLEAEIQERRQAESALQASETSFRSLFEKSATGYVLTSPEGRLLKVNAALADMLGYAIEAMQRVNFQEITHPDDLAVSAETVRCLLAGEQETYRFEKRYLHRTGAAVWTFVNTSLVRDSQNTPLYFITSITDITERKRVEEALRESNTRYELVFENSGTANAIFDVNCRLILQNNLSTQSLGVKPGEALGKTALEVFGPQRGPTVTERMRRVLDSAATETFETEFNLPVGKKWFRSIYQPIFDPQHNVVAVQVVSQDITEQKAAEENLRNSEWRFRLLAENSTDIIARQDASGRFLYVSPACRGLLGYVPEALIGQSISDYIHPDHRSALEQSRARILQQPVAATDLYRFRCQSGDYLWLETTSHALFDAATGTALEVHASSRDVTERVRAEQALQTKNAELERLTYTISHDLKSPLVTIKTFLGYLEQDRVLPDATRALADMRYMEFAADKMGRLLDDLLEMSRVGRVVHPPTRVTFQELARETLSTLAGPLTERHVEVQVSDAAVSLSGDRPRLAEIWQNLVENAIKFMGAQAAPRIDLGVDGRANTPVFFVRDNGQGIEPRYQAKIFELFEKLDPASEGTGLGLALVKRIVELYAGKIWVESQGPGEGATFWFTLPDALRQGEADTPGEPAN